MDFIIEPVPLHETEYQSLIKLIYAKSGINLGEHKQELLKARLGKRLRALGVKSYDEYFKYVTSPSHNEELTMMINAISTNFTSFYREEKHYDFFSSVVLADIVQKKTALHTNKIRGWCAAAATGEEPYSLGITLLEYFKERASKWDIKLLATDISTKVLGEAYHGTYPYERVKTVPPVLLERYFEKNPGENGPCFRVKDEVRRLIIFKQLNLMDEVFPFKGTFDFIFCRNVMIYFDPATQERLVEKLLKYLQPGGYLFTSRSENLPPVFRGQMEALAPAVYRKN